jgi:hypothetical protein
MMQHSPVPKFMVIEGTYQGNPDLPFPANEPYSLQSQSSIGKSIR